MRPSGSKYCGFVRSATRRVADRRRKAVVAGAILVGCAAILAGCVDSLPYSALPSLGRDNRPVMTAEQQKAATTEIEAKKAAERAQALKQIEGSR
jgi:hypothetical protein